MKAKTKFTRLWSVLLVLVMVVGMIPIAALATGPVAVTADFTSGDGSAALALLNAAKTEGVADSVWDSTTNTLTLNGVNFETTAATAVKLPDGSTIVLNGVNTIKGVGSSSEDSYGIYADGALTIQGTGTLNVTGGDTSSRSCGIYANNGNVIISGGTITATGGTSGRASLGIYSYNDKNVEISGGTVTATGGTATDDGSFGINAEGEVKISGGKVEATADEGSYYGYGIYNKAYISGGTITAASAYGEAIPNVNLKGSGYKTISFNGNGGSGHMKAYTKDGSYTLPANGFAAPDDKVFKGWKVGEEIKAVGDTIDVSGSIPTVYA